MKIADRYPDLYSRWMDNPTEVRFPNGEAFAEMRARVLRAVDAIWRESEGQTGAIVSHGGVNRILIAQALQMPDHALFQLAQDHAAINLLSFMSTSPSVQLVNHNGAVLARREKQERQCLWTTIRLARRRSRR